MPVVTDITQLSTTASSNYPTGTENANTVDDYIRQQSAFIAQLRDRSVSVKDYGATGDGVTNDTAAIQSAIAVLSTAGGGDLCFSQGVFLVDGEVLIPDHIRLVGAGAAYENDAQTFYGTWLKLKDSAGLTTNQGVVRFKYDNAETDQRHMGGAYRIGVIGNRSNNTHGSGFIVEGCRYITIEHCGAVRCAGDGIRVVSDTATTGDGDIDTANDTYLHHNNCVFNGMSGISFAGGDSTIIGNICGQNDIAGINLNGASTTQVIGNQCWYNIDGILIAATSAHDLVVGNQCFDNDRSGILVSAGSSYHDIVGNQCFDNGIDPSTLYATTQEAGILVSGASTDLNISGNHLYESVTRNGGANQKYGISLQNASAVIACDGNYGTGNANAFSYVQVGASVVKLELIDTATTVGAAGAASALPANPTGYIVQNINGTNRKIPYYAV